MSDGNFKTHNIDPSGLSISATPEWHTYRSAQDLKAVPSMNSTHFTLRNLFDTKPTLFVVHSSTNVRMRAQYFVKRKGNPDEQEEENEEIVRVLGGNMTPLPFPLNIDDDEETTGFYLLDDQDKVVIKITLTH